VVDWTLRFGLLPGVRRDPTFAIDLLDAYAATYLREQSNTKPSSADSWSVRRGT
jgi:hypothetical protein